MFRIDRIVFEINLTNDRQNKIVNVLSNDHFKRQDEFCGKDKSISLRASAPTMAPLHRQGTIFQFIVFLDHP